ncbi:MAG: hypothetical protein WA102_00085 [Candidatus Methanoperedens sp.]
MDNFTCVQNNIPKGTEDFHYVQSNFSNGQRDFPLGMDNFPQGIKDFSYVQSNIPEGIEDFPYGKTVNPSPGRAGKLWRSTFHRRTALPDRKIYRQKTIANPCT